MADNLKLGKFIEPQSYDESTIYFSDLVGFLQLTIESNPMQVHINSSSYCPFMNNLRRMIYNYVVLLLVSLFRL